eukprot:COSAG01_NODE_2055_length_8535_cov_16.143314_1_plen_74_part_10
MSAAAAAAARSSSNPRQPPRIATKNATNNARSRSDGTGALHVVEPKGRALASAGRQHYLGLWHGCCSPWRRRVR